MLLLGLVLATTLLLARPHDVLHHKRGGECAFCHLHASEPPDPILIGLPVFCVAHLGELPQEPLAEDWDWSAGAPRAPPAEL